MALATDSPWRTIASAALLGTERQPFQLPNISGNLGHYLSQSSDRPNEAALLSAVGVVSLHQHVGWLPEVRSMAQGESCSAEDLPRCSPRAARYLQQILEGQFQHLLSEWLENAAIAGQRVPEMLLPSLLDKGRQQRELRASVLPVLGQRGRWLAAQNSDWNYAVALTTEADWETGKPSARLLYLQGLRSHNPEHARELLQSTWKQETASDRAKFLEAFRIGLSLTDEPFLEDGLGDRSKEVRRVAVDLLASLPDSRLCQQVTEHVCRCLILEQNKDLSLQVQLPEQLDNTLIQLGIEPKLTAAVNAKVGEKAWWLLQMIGATPLNNWTERWQLCPEEIVKLIQSHDWQMVLLNGFALAAKRQTNKVWLEAIFKLYFTDQVSISDAALIEISVEDLFKTLAPDRRDALLIDLFQVFHRKINDSLTIWLLRSSAKLWSFDLARLVLDGLEEHLDHTKTSSNSDWELRSALQEFARFIPVSLTSEVVRLRESLANDSHWINSMNDLIALLAFRKEMVQAFGLGDGG